MLSREFVLDVRAGCRQAIVEMDAEMELAPQSDSAGGGVEAPELAARMRCLPPRCLYVLLLHYGCGVPYCRVERLLELDGAQGIGQFALRLLSAGMGPGAAPSKTALQAASGELLAELGAQTAGESPLPPSHRHRRTMQRLLQPGARHGVPEAPRRLPRRALLVAALVAALVLGLAALAIAALSRSSFRWNFTRTEEGLLAEAVDILREPTQEDYEAMRLYHPQSLPEGFAYAYTDDTPIYYLMAYYHSGDGQRIILWKTLAGPDQPPVFSVMNNELESLVEYQVGGTAYYSYRHATHGRMVVHWEQDGFAFMLVAPTDRETAVEIAASVEKE